MEQDTKTQHGPGSVALRRPDDVHHYEAQVARKRPSREEVKAQLEAKSADISARIASIQSDVFGGTRKIQELAKGPLVPVLGSLVGGVAVGLIFGGTKSQSGRSRTIPDEVAQQLVDEIHKADEDGEDPVQAATATLRQTVGPVGRSSGRSTGIVSAIGGLLVNLAVRQAIAYVEARLSEDRERPQDPSDG